MNILITGGTGLIGTALYTKLRHQHQLTVLTRDTAKAYKQLGHDIQAIQSLAQLDNLNDFDAVINLAGEPIAGKRWSNAQVKKIEQSRFQITEQLVQLIQASSEPPTVLISGSAIGYYGRQGRRPVTETDYHAYDEFTHQLCAKWEAIAQQAESEQTRVCLLRTGVVLAPRGGALAQMALPFKLGMGGPISDGQQMMSWVHLDDIVDIIIFLLQHETLHGPFNATAPQPVSNNEFSRTLAATLKRPCLVRVPSFAMRILLGDMAEMLLTGQAVLPERLQKSGYQFRYTNLEDALRACLLTQQPSSRH